MVSPQFQIYSKPNIHQEGAQGGLIMYLHEILPTSPDVESLGQEQCNKKQPLHELHPLHHVVPGRWMLPLGAQTASAADPPDLRQPPVPQCCPH